MIEEALSNLLSADATLAALVPTIASEKMPPTWAPNLILFTNISGKPPDMVLDGSGADITQRFQFDIYVSTDDYLTCRQIRDRLLRVLNIGLTDVTLADGSQYTIKGINPDGFGRYLPDATNQNTRYTMDFMVMFSMY